MQPSPLIGAPSQVRSLIFNDTEQLYLNDTEQIYICLANNRNTSGVAQPSTIKPSFSTEGVGNHQAFKTADGYIWKYLYELSVVKVAAFLSSNFMPVAVFDSATASGAAEQDQAKIRKTAVPGQIIGVEVVDPGAGYSSTPTLNIIGNGIVSRRKKRRNPSSILVFGDCKRYILAFWLREQPNKS